MPSLEIDEVRSRVEEIRRLGDDSPARSHARTDELWRDVLLAIVAGHPSPSTLAAVALETEGIDFPRWYA